MPKVIKPLSAIAVSKITTPGWHAVGGVSGLALQVRASQRQLRELKTQRLRESDGSENRSRYRV
jgi:hypothetical protein